MCQHWRIDTPTRQHTDSPTYRLTNIPTRQLTGAPTYRRANLPTRQHTDTPTYQLANIPTRQPFISAFMIASKVVCDDTYSNKSWAVVPSSPPPIAPAVVEATRDIVSTSSALSPRYLFVSKHLPRLASLSSRCRCLCCTTSLLHFLFSLHTRIDPTTTAFTTGAPCPRIVHSRFFWTHVVVPPRASSRPIPCPCSSLTHIKRLCFAARVILFLPTY